MSAKVLTVNPQQKPLGPVPPVVPRIFPQLTISRRNSEPVTIPVGRPLASPSKRPSTPIKTFATRTSIMADRYYRTSSPTGRRLAPPDRSSTGKLAPITTYDSYYDSARNRDPYAVSPRSSGEKLTGGGGGVIPISTETYVTPSTRSSAYSGAYAGRPRRSTLTEADVASYSSSSRSRPIVTHERLVRPNSPLKNTYDREGAYVTTGSSHHKHKRLYSVDDSGNTVSLDPSSRNYDSWGTSDHRGRDRSERHEHRDRERHYHLSGSAAKSRNVDESYSYTDAAGMFRETEPRWRRQRGSVEGRGRDRPISMLEAPAGYTYAQHRPSRDMGPPPSTRGFDRLNEGITRGGSVREAPRSSSRDRAPAYLGVERAATFDVPIRPNSTRPPTEIPERSLPVDQRDQRYAYRPDPYDDRDAREPRRPDRRFTDREVENRGFGIRSGSVDYSASSRDESRDRRVPPAGVYPAGVPPPIVTEPSRKSSVNDYAPSHVVNETKRHHERRLSEQDYPRDRHRSIPDDYVDDSGRLLDRERPSERPSVSGTTLAATAGAAAAGAYAANEIAERRKDRRHDDEDDRRSRRTKGDVDDVDERPRDRDRDRERERDRDRDRERERERDRKDRDREEKPAKAAAEEIDPDEDYRRRVQAELNNLQGLSRTSTREDEASGSDRDRERRRRDRDARERDREATRGLGSDEEELAALPAPPATAPPSFVRPPPPAPITVPAKAPAHDASRDDSHNQRTPSMFGEGYTQEPGELAPPMAVALPVSDHSDSGSHPTRSRSSSVATKETRVRIVEPPKEEKDSPPLRGILKQPTRKFPEDPNPIREGVAPLKDAKKEELAKKEGIPQNARWTKIDRTFVNPQALDEAGERYEERMDCVIVLRVLTKDEVQKLSDRTKMIRGEP